MPYNSAMTAVLKCNNCAKSTILSRGALHSHSLIWVKADDALTAIIEFPTVHTPVRLVHESNTEVQP
jgi:hypothetical protein